MRLMRPWNYEGAKVIKKENELREKHKWDYPKKWKKWRKQAKKDCLTCKIGDSNTL